MTEEINTFKEMVNQYGLPIMAAGGMGYFIYFVWKFVTENINTELSNAKKTMIDLIDRIRMLDNDLIRLEQKINTAIEVQRAEKVKEHEAEQNANSRSVRSVDNRGTDPN
jgi:hypothetical protein